MKKIVTYPAVFHLEENGAYFVEFPDLPGCLTQGKTMEEAVHMAQDALGLFLLDESDYPVASNPKKIELDDDSFVSFVSQDMFEYRKRYNSKVVR